jgi:hypothetical protein
MGSELDVLEAATMVLFASGLVRPTELGRKLRKR